MVSLHQITIGQQAEFMRILADAGFDKSMIDFIIKNPVLARDMFESIRDSIPVVTVHVVHRITGISKIRPEFEAGLAVLFDQIKSKEGKL